MQRYFISILRCGVTVVVALLLFSCATTPRLPIITPSPPVITPLPPVVTPSPPAITPPPPIVTPSPPVVTPDAPTENEPSRNIAAHGTKTAEQLAAFFLSNNPAIPHATVLRLANYYLNESRVEGINSDVAFVQMCLETGFLRFGNLVTADMYNFCGLGAIDAERRGEYFPTEEIGVRAHIQHLHAYGTTAALQQDIVDNRYKYVIPRGKAPDIFGLAKTWATDPDYGKKLDKMLTMLADF